MSVPVKPLEPEQPASPSVVPRARMQTHDSMREESDQDLLHRLNDRYFDDIRMELRKSAEARAAESSLRDLLDELVRGLGEDQIGGSLDSGEDNLWPLTVSYLDEVKRGKCTDLAEKMQTWLKGLAEGNRLGLLLLVWKECFDLWDRALTYRAVGAIIDAAESAISSTSSSDWTGEAQSVIVQALSLMRLDGAVFREIQLSRAEELGNAARDAQREVENIWQRLRKLGALRQECEQAQGQELAISPEIYAGLDHIEEYARQTKLFFGALVSVAEAVNNFEKWTGGNPPDGSNGSAWPSSAHRSLGWDEAAIATAESLEKSLEELRWMTAVPQISEHTLSECEPWIDLLQHMGEVLCSVARSAESVDVIVPRCAWVRYCFPFAVYDKHRGLRKQLKLGKIDDPDKQPARKPKIHRQATATMDPAEHPFIRRLKEELSAYAAAEQLIAGHDLAYAQATEAIAAEDLANAMPAEPFDLAQTEFFAPASSELSYGGIRVVLPDLLLTGKTGQGQRTAVTQRYRTWLDLNRMGNFCLCVESREALRQPTPGALYRQLRLGTPFVYGEPVELVLKSDSRVKPIRWDNLQTYARHVIRAAAEAYYRPEKYNGPPEEYRLPLQFGNVHEVVMVQTDGVLAAQSEDIADYLDRAVGGRILLRSVQRAACTLDEWLRFPPLQRDGRHHRVSAIPEIGFLGDWFAHTGETTVFGFTAAPAWFRDVYPEAAQFASSWSPLLQLWNNQLQETIQNGQKDIKAEHSENLRQIDQQIRNHLAQINSEQLCSTLAYRRFLDELLDAVGVDRMEKELDSQLKSAEQLVDYLNDRRELKDAQRRDQLLLLIALLGVFTLTDFLTLADTTNFFGKTHDYGTWQDVVVVALFVLTLSWGLYVMRAFSAVHDRLTRFRDTIRQSGRTRLWNQLAFRNSTAAPRRRSRTSTG